MGVVIGTVVLTLVGSAFLWFVGWLILTGWRDHKDGLVNRAVRKSHENWANSWQYEHLKNSVRRLEEAEYDRNNKKKRK